jgi:hypothetical protein
MIFQIKLFFISVLDNLVWIKMQLIGSIALPILFLFMFHRCALRPVLDPRVAPNR